MSNKSFKISKSLYLKPVDLATLTSPQDGEIAIDINDSNKLKKYNGSSWVEVGGGSSVDNTTDELLIQNFESAVLADFTQTGLELISSPFIHGTKTARLIHQASSTRSFKQIKSVDPKFRGKNLTLRLDARSCALSANVTVLVTDETNSATLISSTFTTGQITAAVFNTTNASASVTVTDNSILNSISIGASITGSGIPTGTTVIAKGTSTITLSQNATATATGVSLKVSALPNIQSYSFNVPSNCSSISYTISALQEAGLPETYVDDIVIELTQQALQSASVTVPKNNDTSWTACTFSTNAWQGFGNVVSNLECRRDGSSLKIRGKFTVGTVTTSVAQIPFPTNFGNITTTSTIQNNSSIGTFLRDVATTAVFYNVLISPSSSVIQFSLALIAGPNNPATPVSGDSVFSSGQTGSVVGEWTIPIQGWSANETESKTIPLTSSVLVTESDSSIRVGTANGYGSSGTRIRRFLNILESIGSSVRYVSDAVNGDYFEILEDGEYDISYSDQFSSAGGEDFAITKNATNLNTSYTNTPENLVICNSSTYGTNYRGTCSAQVYLVKGDKLRAHTANASSVGSTPNNCKFTISKVGSTKILNPSSDQKIEIPTHELRFEGASSRGSTDTAIVKFDTLAKIKGDGFTVTNTAANGTVITIQKKGRLTISTSSYFNSSAYFSITRNQATLTTVPLASEVLANEFTSGTNDTFSIGWTGDVDKNDIIRVCSTGNPIASISNILTLSLQENSVAVALQNVAPRWDDSDTSLMLSGANGFGTTATTVRRFSSVTNNLGTAISYVDTPDSGAVFTVNESGLYSIKYQDDQSSTSPTSYGISIGNSVIPTSIAYQTFNQIAVVGISSGVIYLTKGQKFVVGSVNPNNVFASSIYTRLYISKVGKTQGTVDVTPFVNMRTHENIVGEVLAYAGTNTPDNFLLCDGRAVSRTTYAELFNVIGTSHGSGDGSTTFNIPDYRGRFLRGVDGTAGNDPDKASRTAMSTGGNIGNNVGSVQADQLASHSHNIRYPSGGSDPAGPAAPWSSPNTRVWTSDGIQATGGNETRPKNAYVNYIIRFAKDQMGIATPTEQVSSDTMNFVFKPTAIVDSDPVGTFNTYKKAPNSQAATTLCTTAPTQSISSMNINGVLVTAANYATAGTDALPNRFDIKIGKGLKGWNVLGYNNTGRLTEIMLDLLPYNTAELYGITKTYNETTGILTIDAGFNNNTTITNRGYLLKIGAVGAGTTGYFTFSASKSPSLVSIPNLQQRVAYLSDVKPNAVAGGSFNAGIWVTRDLNTLTGDTSFVTLSANSFTLKAGVYDIEASSPVYLTNLHKTILVDSNTSAIELHGTNGRSHVTNGGSDRSFIQGTITVVSDKTFEIRHRCSTVKATDGLGIPMGFGIDEVYTQVKITKIK